MVFPSSNRSRSQNIVLHALFATLMVAGLSCSLVGCRSKHQPAPQPKAQATASTTSKRSGTPSDPTLAAKASGPVVPIKLPSKELLRQGSTVALGTLEGHAVAFVADTDLPGVHVIDRTKNTVLSSTKLPAEPAQMLVTPDGKLLVALRGSQGIQILSGRAGGKVVPDGLYPTTPEPFGLALTPDASTLVVTSIWGQQLQGFSLASKKQLFSIKLPRDPRSVLITNDGKRAFVSHAAGSMASMIVLSATGSDALAQTIRLDGATNIPSYTGNHSYRFGSQGFTLVQNEKTIFVPQTLTNAGIRTEKPGLRGGGGGFQRPGTPRHRFDNSGYGGGDDPYPIVLQDIAIIDSLNPYTTDRSPALAQANKIHPSAHFLHLRLGKTMVAEPDSVVMSDGLDAHITGQFNACQLPKAAVMDSIQQTILVVCQGTDVALELDATAKDPGRHELRRFSLPSGPTGIALDTKQRQAVVFSQFDRALVTISLGKATPPVPKKERPFNQLVSVNDGKKGEKKIEVLVPKGRINLPAVAGKSATLVAGRKLFHVTNHIGISGDGRACASCHPDGYDDGLTWSTPEGPKQTVTLASHSLSKTGPYGWRGQHKTIDAHLQTTFRRLHGKGLAEPEVAALTEYLLSMKGHPKHHEQDSQILRGKKLFEGPTACAACHPAPLFTDRQAHDVKSGGTFDTPSLLSISSSAPYFHDGRYQTLKDVLANCEGKMGTVAGLTPADLSDLEAYLKSLLSR
jgi:DNA-binding beta-propeller fold protein YncE